MKFLLVATVTGFVFYKLIYTYRIDDRLNQTAVTFNSSNFIFLAAAFVLMFLNWYLEITKWKLLVNKYENINFKFALKAVLSGIVLGIITPNQVGDFAGRVIHLQKLNKIKGSFLTAIGHTAQVLMTTIFGMYALIILLAHKDFYNVNNQPMLAIICFVFQCLLILGFLNLKLLHNFLIKIKWFSKLEKYFDIFKDFSKSELAKVLLISFVRYVVFLFQYYFLLLTFGVNISFENAMLCVAASFCVQSVVPSFLLLDLGLRGATALLFFGEFSANQDGILLAAYSLWVINIMLPALLGLFFIVQLKYRRS